MNVKLLIYFLLIGAPVFGQQIIPKILLDDVKTLSSEAYKGRKTGTKENAMAAAYIAERFTKAGLSAYKPGFKHPFNFKDRKGVSINGTNIVGYIKGKTNKTIAITAHYDHIGIVNNQINNGVDDNASGVAALMAYAMYFSKNKPQHTLVFAALDAEEMGLQGAKALVADPPVPISDLLLNINMDMIAHNNKGELYASGTYHYPFLKKYLKGQYKDIRLLTGHDDPQSGSDDWTGQSDHAAFHAKKIPFIYFGVEDHQDYHKPTDDFENINKGFFINAAGAILDIIKKIDQDPKALLQQSLKEKMMMN